MKILWLSYGDCLAESGYAARVRSELQYLSEIINHNLSILTLGSQRNAFTIPNVNIRKMYCLQRHTRSFLFLLDMMKALIIIFKIASRDKHFKLLIHAHNLYSAIIANVAKSAKRNIQVIFDVHGLVPEEFVWLKKGKRRGIMHRYLSLFERWCVLKSDFIICASNSLKQNLLSRYNFSPQKIAVIPNISVFPQRSLLELNAVKTSLKKAYGLENTFVLAHLGSVLRWANLQKLIEVFQKINNMTSGVLLVLTYEPIKEVSQHLIKVLDPSSFCIFHVSYEQIPDFLPIADLGLIIRDSSIINQVAFPTKFSEYVACGLPVICSDVVEDVAHDIIKYELGYVLAKNEITDTTLKKLADYDSYEMMRKNCIHYFATQLKKAKENLLKIYHQFISS